MLSITVLSKTPLFKPTYKYIYSSPSYVISIKHTDSGIAGSAYVPSRYKQVSGSNEYNFTVKSARPIVKNLHLYLII